LSFVIETLELLDLGYQWTAARIAAVQVADLDAPTPCRDWDLRRLLHHTYDSLTQLTDAVAQDDDVYCCDVEDACWGPAFVDLATRAHHTWREEADVLDRVCQLPLGETPAAVVADITLLEVVVHGWDVSHSTGEDASIPDQLAQHVLAFARQPVVDAQRGDAFAADLHLGVTPSDRLVAFLGRRP
jgi:uncharacterized protein (TIGR03086 family)